MPFLTEKPFVVSVFIYLDDLITYPKRSKIFDFELNPKIVENTLLHDLIRSPDVSLVILLKGTFDAAYSTQEHIGVTGSTQTIRMSWDEKVLSRLQKKINDLLSMSITFSAIPDSTLEKGKGNRFLPNKVLECKEKVLVTFSHTADPTRADDYFNTRRNLAKHVNTLYDIVQKVKPRQLNIASFFKELSHKMSSSKRQDLLKQKTNSSTYGKL